MKTYEQRIAELENEGLTTSDAQAVIDAENQKALNQPALTLDAYRARNALNRAAPDLLEALELALPFIEAKEGTSDENDIIVDKTRAAIAKARGQV